MRLRPELLRFERPDGGVDVLDLLLERLVPFSLAEARHLDALDAAPPALCARIADLLLDETPTIEIVRRQAYAARAGSRLEAPDVAAAEGLWERARELPVGPRWRDPEAWRRLAESRAAGRSWLELPGFLDANAAAALARDVAAMPFGRLSTALVNADRCDVFPDLFAGDALRALLGGALGVALPARVKANGWRLGPGDSIGVHPDGLRYLATFSLGLCEAWTASHGGAIAFGVPPLDPGAPFEVHGRWLPHLGDLLLFRPSARSWHAVEPVRHGVRHTVTGWYVP